MATFRNEQELLKYVNKKGISGSGAMSNAQWESILVKEAKRLKILIQRHIGDYYRSYTPTSDLYHRTYGLMKSVNVTTVKYKDGLPTIKVYFDDKSIHSSIFKGGKDGITNLLINYGWKWRSRPAYIAHFHYYTPGYDFVGKALEEWSQNNKYGLTAEVNAYYEEEILDMRQFF